MSLIKDIIECDYEELNFLIESAIQEANSKASKVEIIGFENVFAKNTVFKGFIPFSTKIKYASHNMETYNMQTKDFFYDFAKFVKDNNYKTGMEIVLVLEYFINSYFGIFKHDIREYIFNQVAWNTSTTDEEYFAKLENNEIGDLKGQSAAMCTERAALAQQILSLFGFEAYYCIGCIDLGYKQEPHAFNIVKRKNDYAILDYSIPVMSYNTNNSIRNYYSFVGILSNEEFENFINNQEVKSFNDYFYDMENKKVETDNIRNYVVGKFQIDKTDNKII